MPVSFDPFSPAHRDDPYPKYRELRDHAPVHFSPEANVWCVSRYDDVQQVLKSPDVFSSRAMFTMLMNGGNEEPPSLTPYLIGFLVRMALRTRSNPLGFGTARTLIADDGERHTGMRAIVNRGFSPRRIAAWEKRARELVAECMAKLDAGAPFDLVHDLAIPLPVTIIAEMLGVETERLADFKRWSDVVIEKSTGAGRADPFAPKFMETMLEMAAYITRLARERKRRPADDLISVIAASSNDEAGLSTREIFQFVMLLLVAGNETTTNLIGNAVNALLDHPAELARAAADPKLVPSLVEEALRFDSPVQLVLRKAVTDTEIAGVPIPAGAIVAPLLGSANRDERRFPDPDRFDAARDPQGHVAFGFGKHFCLGASLARLEARVALEALVPRLVGLAKRERRVARIDSFLVRGPQRLDLDRAA